MRWLTGLLAIVLALGILAGCGDDEDEPQAGPRRPRRQRSRPRTALAEEAAQARRR